MNSIRDLRRAKGWSQQALASRAGIGIQTVVRMEKGRPTLGPMVDAVATALGVTRDDLDVKIANRVKS
jgi:transcriptional regulator with XRE-family HTH domain